MVQIVFMLEFGLERLIGQISIWSSLQMVYVGREQSDECRCLTMLKHLQMCGLGLGASTMVRTLQGAGLKQCAEAPTVWSNDSHTIALLIHVDDLIVTGTDEAMDSLLRNLEESYKVSVEMGNQVNFLKRTLTSEDGVTKIQMNDKYLDGLVTLFEGVKQKRTLNEVVYDEKLLETAEKLN